MHEVLRAARNREKKLIAFLQDLIRIQSLSTEEGPVIERIRQEMHGAAFDEVRVDRLGNIIGRIGQGSHTIAMDAHIDTVAVNDVAAWEVPPFAGEVRDGQVYGRGAVDQKAGMAALVHAGALIKDLGLQDDFTLYVVGSVQEEDRDGLCWQYLVREGGLRPECVIITEPSKLNLNIGHRGRAAIKIRTRGKAAHGSAPERGVNAVYEMGHVLKEIEHLHERLPCDGRLGKGSVTVTNISCGTPSLCSVPDECIVHLDRRLTLDDTPESVIGEVAEAVRRAGEDAQVFIPDYDATSHRGLRYPVRMFYPAWVLPATSPLVTIGKQTFQDVFDHEPLVGTWQFSTNGVATNGLLGIPTMGLGPGDETYAHAVNERVPVEEVVAAAAWYAWFPSVYAKARRGHQ